MAAGLNAEGIDTIFNGITLYDGAIRRLGILICRLSYELALAPHQLRADNGTDLGRIRHTALESCHDAVIPVHFLSLMNME